MRKLLCLSVLLLVPALLAGCNGMVKTWDDRKSTYREVWEFDQRQIADDWDRIWLAERQYRLTRWQTR